MIVAEGPAGLAVVLQVDHQEQCRVAAEAWGNREFARLDDWEAVVEAAGCHDEGWRTWESAPEIDAGGRPVDFPKLDRARHIALYRDGIAAAVRRGALVGLLVSLHGEGLYRARLGIDGEPRPPERLPPPARDFVRDQQLLQAHLRSGLGDGPELEAWAWAAYRLLQAWDTLSLYLTWRGLPTGRPGRLPAVPRAAGDPGVPLELEPVDALTARCRPFPFAGDEAVLPVVTRVIPARTYASHDDLRAELAAAEVELREYRVVGPGAA